MTSQAKVINRMAYAGLLLAVLASLLVIGVVAFSDPAPVDPPAPTPTETRGPELLDIAPQAKVVTERTCRFVTRRFYGRDSGLEPWELTGVERTPTGRSCP